MFQAEASASAKALRLQEGKRKPLGAGAAEQGEPPAAKGAPRAWELAESSDLIQGAWEALGAF